MLVPFRGSITAMNKVLVVTCDILESEYGSRYDARIGMILEACRHLMIATAEFDRALS
jgi:hypothetical protein